MFIDFLTLIETCVAKQHMFLALCSTVRLTYNLSRVCLYKLYDFIGMVFDLHDGPKKCFFSKGTG